MKQQNFKVGDKVTYHRPFSKKEKGIVKEVPECVPNSLRVVYHCNNDWERYKDYTSALTRIEDLEKGWAE